MHVFQFSYIATSSAFFHYSELFSFWLQHFRKFYNLTFNFLSRMTSSLLQTRPGLHYFSRSTMCHSVTSNESLNFSNPWLPIWKMEIMISLTLRQQHGNLERRKLVRVMWEMWSPWWNHWSASRSSPDVHLTEMHVDYKHCLPNIQEGELFFKSAYFCVMCIL